MSKGSTAKPSIARVAQILGVVTGVAVPFASVYIHRHTMIREPLLRYGAFIILGITLFVVQIWGGRNADEEGTSTGRTYRKAGLRVLGLAAVVWIVYSLLVGGVDYAGSYSYAISAPTCDNPSASSTVKVVQRGIFPTMFEVWLVAAVISVMIVSYIERTKGPISHSRVAQVVAAVFGALTFWWVFSYGIARVTAERVTYDEPNHNAAAEWVLWDRSQLTAGPVENIDCF